MTYLKLVSANRRLLAFGLVTALASSFGQTFFISLFLSHFLDEFSLGKGDFGLLYAAATLTGALLLPYLGSRIDRADLSRYTSLTVIALAVSALVVGVSNHVILLGAGIVGLRLMGQGLLGHISQTVMAREFGASRGKALGVAGIGYPLGEAVLPVFFAAALRFIDWRTAWILVSVAAAAAILPATIWLLKGGSPQTSPAAASAPASVMKSDWKLSQLLRDRRFYFLMPSILATPFALTGMFLYQVPLSQSKGWAPEWMAAAFAGFAISRAVSSLLVGPLIDRYSALRLLPFYVMPMGMGILLLTLVSSPWIAFLYLALAGVTAGVSGSVSSAVWMEVYGAENLGRIRSLAASLGVFSTAASPAMMGWLFQWGVGFNAMLSGMALAVLLSSVLTVPASPWASSFRQPLQYLTGQARESLPGEQ